MTPAPVLVAAPHGTADPVGQASTRDLLNLVRQLRPGLIVEVGWLDVIGPSLADTLAAQSGPVVIVPVLLSTGYHVGSDIPAVVGLRPLTVLAKPLGPDERVLRVVLKRIESAAALAGAPMASGEPILLVGAGSSDPAALAELRTAAQTLSAISGSPVSVGALTDPHLFADALPTRLVANYLMAPGYFDTKLRTSATANRADAVVGVPIGAADLIAELVVQRYEDAAALLDSSR